MDGRVGGWCDSQVCVAGGAVPSSAVTQCKQFSPHGGHAAYDPWHGGPPRPVSKHPQVPSQVKAPHAGTLWFGVTKQASQGAHPPPGAQLLCALSACNCNADTMRVGNSSASNNLSDPLKDGRASERASRQAGGRAGGGRPN
jgi:hypothetical protein